MRAFCPMKVVRRLSTCKTKYRSEIWFTDENDKQHTSSKEKNPMHKVTIDQSMNMELFTRRDDASRLHNLPSSKSLPCKNKLGLHKKYVICMQDPLKCIS